MQTACTICLSQCAFIFKWRPHEDFLKRTLQATQSPLKDSRRSLIENDPKVTGVTAQHRVPMR